MMYNNRHQCELLCPHAAVQCASGKVSIRVIQPIACMWRGDACGAAFAANNVRSMNLSRWRQ